MFRARRGEVRAAFSAEEARALRKLIGEYLALLDADIDPADPVGRRLFPPASLDDEALAEEYASLAGSDLDTHKREAARAVLGTLPEGPVKTVLDAASAESWLVVLTDLRLILGVRLGVTEESYESGALDVGPGGDEEAAALGFGVFQYLGALQEMLVQALARNGV